MKKRSFIKFFLILLIVVGGFFGFSSAEDGLNILYGEHVEMLKTEDNTSRIFYDQNGDLYPDYFISDRQMKEAGGSLKTHFENNPEAFLEVATQYQLSFSSYSKENYRKLQDTVLENLIKEINRKSTSYDMVHFLVHGFRKPFKNQSGSSSTSIQDNRNLKRSIATQNDNLTNDYFVEVYWDGTYDCCFSKNLFKNHKLFKLFKDRAQGNAVVTGYQLRKLVPRIEKEKVALISHSLGARVLTTCLFNVFEKEVPDAWTKWPTPDQEQVQVCMIAPAIALDPFEHYHERNSKTDFKSDDNYRLFIVYNEDDFVLLKKWRGWGPGPKRYGETTLGCNYEGEVRKLESLFKNNYPQSTIRASHSQDIGICHLVRCYTSSSNFREMLEFLDGV